MDWTINVTSRVKNVPPLIIGINLLTKKNGSPLGGHVFQANTNLLTKCHQDWTINVASRPTGIIFKLVQDIIGINLLTKFHEDWTMNVASRVKNAPPLGSHVFQAKVTISTLTQDIIKTTLLRKFHDDRNINGTSRVLTKKNAPPLFHDDRRKMKIAPPPFELFQNIIGMNLLTEFHEDRTINVASRVKNVPPLGGPVFLANVTIFELIQDIIKTNLLTKFHQDWTKNVASRKLTSPASWRPCFSANHIIGINLLTKKNAPPLGRHVFQAKTNLLRKFHEDRTINGTSRVFTRKNAPPPGGHGFQPTGIIFEFFQDTIGMNFLTKFHEDRTINVASRVLSRENAPPLGSHVFQANVTMFELIHEIIKTNLLTKFH
ncbi:hypothetical protein DPMN_192366 [Dreissena polymorpha]|uniref:Uncharacterized protein n=1 Tax=Dreissena polymorpha TaxID=45954 RepID=A0A9D4B6Q7_DREPO|nr:hypothetical protein DPMN_192366 [Dreissena polymorpha]